MIVKPRLGLTAWLTLLVLGAVAPLLVFGGLTLRGILDSARALADRRQVDTVRALALAVDGEVHAWKAALAALAESPSVQPGRWAEFYEQARQVGAQHEGWVVLTAASGEQIFNTLRPFGTPLQKTSSPETIDAIFREGKPIVSDLIWGQNAQRYLVAVAMPVVRGGKVVNCLTLNFSPDRLTTLLLRPQFPASWVASITDRQRRVVARSVLADARVGKPVVEWFAAATRAAENGIVTGSLMDGRPGQVAFQRLQEVPWVAALAVPVAELQSAAPILGFISAGAILGLVAVGMAVYMGRKVTTPVKSLARAGEGLLRGDASHSTSSTGILEIWELQQAFAQASTAARAHAEERERYAESLGQANEALEARVLERTAALASTNEALRAANVDLQEEIAQRRAAEGEIRNLARFPSENPNPVLRLNSDGLILFANAASAVLLHQWGSVVGGQAPAPWPDAVRRALAGRAGVTVELACGDRTYAASLVPIPEAAYVNLYTVDVTERNRAAEALRQSEALYRAIGETIDYGVWVCAPDGRNTYASESFLKMVGLTQEQCSDFGWGEVLHPDDADRTIAAWKECVRTGGNWDIEHRFRGVDGQWHDILARGVPVKDARGEVFCWAGINLDISRLKRAEAALRQLNVELEQRVAARTADLSQAIQTLERQAQQVRTITTELTLAEQRERRRLADMLHDELQQLLVATRLRAHMLGRTDDQQVRHGAQELVGLIEEALAATRTLTGELSPPSLQRGALLPALEWLIRWMGEKHHLTVRLVGPAAPLPILPEDLTILLYQAVRELLLNTVKYAQVSAAEVTIAHEPQRLTLTVADPGVGFDPMRLRVAGGTDGGVGLFGIRERLEWVGGRLEIASAPGRGSRFTLVAPLGQAIVPSATLQAAGPAEAEPRSPTGRRLRVLLVDDHALVRRGFATLLAGEPDLEVVGEAENGQRAVELTRQLTPDVIVMDVSMPVMNGIDATRAIHAEFPAMRVIGLSMVEDLEQPEAMRQAGAVGYLSKNDSADALLAAIRRAGPPAA